MNEELGHQDTEEKKERLTVDPVLFGIFLTNACLLEGSPAEVLVSAMASAVLASDEFVSPEFPSAVKIVEQYKAKIVDILKGIKEGRDNDPNLLEMQRRSAAELEKMGKEIQIATVAQLLLLKEPHEPDYR